MTMTLSALSAARFFTMTGQQPGWQKPKTRQTRPELQAGLMRDTVRFSGQGVDEVDQQLQAQSDRLILGLIDQVKEMQLDYDGSEETEESRGEMSFGGTDVALTSKQGRYLLVNPPGFYDYRLYRVDSVPGETEKHTALLNFDSSYRRLSYYVDGNTILTTNTPAVLRAFVSMADEHVKRFTTRKQEEQTAKQLAADTKHLNDKQALLAKLAAMDPLSL